MYEGFKKRLEDAKGNSKKVKLMFQFPKSYRITKKSGDVINCDDDTFTVNEKFDGVVTYSYRFLIEISDDNNQGGQKHGQQ